MKRTQDAFHVSGHARGAFKTARSRRSKSARHGDTLESCGMLHRTMYASPHFFLQSSSGLCRLEQDVGMAVSIPGSKLGQQYKNYTCASEYEVPRPLRNRK